jgi:hypothetical protein
LAFGKFEPALKVRLRLYFAGLQLSAVHCLFPRSSA